MQFSAMLCTHVMRLCRLVHKDLVNALCIKDAFDIVRKKLSSEEPGIVAAQEMEVEEKRTEGHVKAMTPSTVFFRFFRFFRFLRFFRFFRFFLSPFHHEQVHNYYTQPHPFPSFPSFH